MTDDPAILKECLEKAVILLDYTALRIRLEPHADDPAALMVDTLAVLERNIAKLRDMGCAPPR